MNLQDPSGARRPETTLRGEVTQVLAEIESGREEAKGRLLELVYDQLRDLAGAMMRGEREGHTLQPTSLVHEAALRMLDEDALARMPNRSYLFRAMATCMRRILIDHARARGAQRRGGDRRREAWDNALDVGEENSGLDVLALDEALRRLQALDPRQAAIVELRYFGGFEMQEIAEQLEVSLSTVEKDWRVARAWLRSQLESDAV
jgi:RNA polymerase sigma factor (TIGR02999 family)